jgi:hypothetical protein
MPPAGSRGRRPRVLTRCVAQRYAAPNERVVEFGSRAGAGLISLWLNEDKNELYVHLYRCDAAVRVFVNCEERKGATS